MQETRPITLSLEFKLTIFIGLSALGLRCLCTSKLLCCTEQFKKRIHFMKVHLLAPIQFACLFMGLSLVPSSALACDVCALALGNKNSSLKPHQTELRLDQQILVMKKTELGNSYVENEQRERLTSSLSHFVFAYGLSEKLTFEASVPLVSRHYRRIAGEGTRTASDSGLGDISFKGEARLLNRKLAGGTATLFASAGIKIPTGDADRLTAPHHSESELEESELENDSDHHAASEAEHDSDEAHQHENEMLRHAGEDHSVPSAIHEHDLAFGTGSFDFPLAVRLQQTWGTWGLGADAQYMVRTSGESDYRYGNDLLYSIWAGYQFTIATSQALWLAVHLSGEHKESDRQAGAEEDASEFRNLYVGPSMALNAANLNTSLSVDIPVSTETEGYQLVPETRVRFSLGFRF